MLCGSVLVCYCIPNVPKKHREPERSMSHHTIPSTVSVPIVWLQDSYKVRHTAVTVDTVIAAFKQDTAPEQIAAQTDLRVDEVYSVIAWYHTFKKSVEAYLTRKSKPVEATRLSTAPDWDCIHMP